MTAAAELYDDPCDCDIGPDRVSLAARRGRQVDAANAVQARTPSVRGWEHLPILV